MAPSTETVKRRKKRAASDMKHAVKRDTADADNGEAVEGELVEYDMNEPTMGEKLESLNLQDDDKSKIPEKMELASPAKLPSADSINVLLKQALHADDRALLLDCLYTQDEKVITNSIALLSPSDVLKLLHSLLSIVQSRGAILICALPWLRSLLLQHASGIMAHESSLHALNSLYQLIDARVSTFLPALQLSTFLDIHFAGIIDESLEEDERIVPIIYEDNDESDEEESEDAMETDRSTEEVQAFDGVGDFEGDDASD